MSSSALKIDGLGHTLECQGAFQTWADAWNAKPVPHPKLYLKFEQAAKHCGCGGRMWE